MRYGCSAKRSWQSWGSVSPNVTEWFNWFKFQAIEQNFKYAYLCFHIVKKYWAILNGRFDMIIKRNQKWCWFEYWIIKPVFKNICNNYDESIRVMCETKYRNRHKNLGKVYSSWFSWDKVFCFEICIFLTVKVEEINILQFNLITLLTCNLKHLVIWVS